VALCTGATSVTTFVGADILEQAGACWSGLELLGWCERKPHAFVTQSSQCCPHLQTQEAPSLLLPLCIGALCPHAPFLEHPLSRRTLCTAAFLLHYLYRSLLFPLLIRGGKGTPVSIWFMSFVFCIWNGYIQVHPAWACAIDIPGSLHKHNPTSAQCPAAAALDSPLATHTRARRCCRLALANSPACGPVV
jgi:hypothetical protein